MAMRASVSASRSASVRLLARWAVISVETLWRWRRRVAVLMGLLGGPFFFFGGGFGFKFKAAQPGQAVADAVGVLKSVVRGAAGEQRLRMDRLLAITPLDAGASFGRVLLGSARCSSLSALFIYPD